MSQKSKVIAEAKKWIGTKENPAGSNKVKFNTDYYGRAVSGAAYPWCVVFLWDVFRMAGASKAFYNGKKTASCAAVWDWGKKDGLTHTSGKIGDLALFSFDGDKKADHIGLVVGVGNNGTYTTIEGNTSTGNNSNGGEVMKRTRKKSQIVVFVRPEYAVEKAATNTAKKTTATKSTYPKTMTVTAKSGLNMRNRPSMSGGIIAAAPKGTKITVKGKDGVWYKVAWKGKNGYMKSIYLK